MFKIDNEQCGMINVNVTLKGQYICEYGYWENVFIWVNWLLHYEICLICTSAKVFLFVSPLYNNYSSNNLPCSLISTELYHANINVVVWELIIIMIMITNIFIIFIINLIIILITIASSWSDDWHLLETLLFVH